MTHRPLEEPLRPVRPHPAEASWHRPPEPDEVDPAVLSALLQRHGWERRGGAAGRYGRWTPPGPGGGGTSLLVPESRAFPDSDDLLGEALVALTRSGTPSAREVLVGLAVPSDEIRWWRDVPTGPLGVAAWTVEEQLRTAAHRMLLAGALAVRACAGYYGARHRRPATASLDGTTVPVRTGGDPWGPRSATPLLRLWTSKGAADRRTTVDPEMEKRLTNLGYIGKKNP